MTEELNKIIEIAAEQLSIDKKIIKPESSISDDLGADSLDKVELTMEIEEAFDIEFSDEELEKVETIQNLLDLIAAKK